MRTHYFLRLCVVFVLLQVNSAQSQDLPFGECRTGYWTSNRNLDDQDSVAKATCFTNWRATFDNGLKLGFNARVGINDTGAGQENDARLREGFVEYDFSDFSWRAGRQIIAWGRADRINPTDSLSTRDFTALLPQDSEQRNGINAVQARYHIDNLSSFTGVLAEFEAHRIPRGTLPQNLIQSPESNRLEMAFKYDKYGDNVDWSVSYFDGFERFARYRVDFTVPTSPVFRGSYERAQTLGADFATAQGVWTVRGEVSYSQKDQNCSSCIQNKREVIQAVFGADRDIGDTANINVQLFSTKRDYISPSQVAAPRRPFALALDRLNSEYASEEYGMTFRVSDRLMNDRLTFEIPAVLDLTNQSYIVRPRANYSFNDSFQMGVGVDNFQGKEQSFFGSRRKNNTAFVELIVLY